MSDSTISVGAGLKAQSGQALQIQNYCNSVNQQINVDFSATPGLSSYQGQVNDGLSQAKAHASNYLNIIQPDIISNISNISNYFALQNAVPATLPKGSTVDQWLKALNEMRTTAQKYEASAKQIQASLTTLNNNLNTDAQNFSSIVTNLNTAVNGDNGVLSSLNSEINTINGDIDGAIAGVVAGGLLIIGGAFVAAIGAVADFVTAGTSTPVVLGGVAMIAAGAGGVAGGSVVLQNALNARQAIYLKQSTLTAEVLIAAQISHGYSGLQAQAKNAVDAATQMSNAWSSLNSDLDALVQDLNNGTTSGDAIRELWLTAANSTVSTVLTDVKTIKNQMAGVTTVTASSQETISSYYSAKVAA